MSKMSFELRAVAKRLLVAGLLASQVPAFAFGPRDPAFQRPLQPFAGKTACTIRTIEARSGLVAAKDLTNKLEIEFTVNDPKVLGGLKVGQLVWADLRGRTVSIPGTTETYAFRASSTAESPAADRPGPGPTPPHPDLHLASDYRVSAVSGGTVTARDRMTGGAIQFSLPVPQASQLTIGQRVWLVGNEAHVVAFPIETSARKDLGGGDHMETTVKISNTGMISGLTRTWTNEALRGFTGGVEVVLLDAKQNELYVTEKRRYGVNGEALGSPSDRKDSWHEEIPVEVRPQVLENVRGVSILQLRAPRSHWDRTVEMIKDCLEIAKDAGAIYTAIAGGATDAGETTPTPGPSPVPAPARAGGDRASAGGPPPAGPLEAGRGSAVPASSGRWLRVPLLGVRSPASENNGDESDPEPALPSGTAPDEKGVRFPLGGQAADLRIRATPLPVHPDAERMRLAVAGALAEFEWDSAILGGHKYMVGECLGIKASVGEFRVRFAVPTVRFEGNDLVIEARIDRITLNALRVRVRPSVNFDPCKFSGAFTVGGSASDVHVTVRFSGPKVDLERCRMDVGGNVEVRWNIGGLNLKPLQNDLDRVAKGMIEDALNATSSVLTARVVRSIDDFLATVCKPTKMVGPQ
ncbi:MAG TPA: hypothetical protein VFI25_03720 [Planctomycetota bacterium]|jgi:hypothetical protein|nr:hypothetical protein [Planctomycetota bacterium]